VGANNAVLGIHVSGWASGKDIVHVSVTDPLQPEVDKVRAFLAPLGLGANATGTTYDVLVGDPLDRDADFYRLTQGQDRWWDAADGAPIASRSFNRYAEWLRLWNQASGKRWVLWQLPLGNSSHRNVSNDGSARAGYKDNRAEYFFGAGSEAHRARFADAGVIALLFGRGEGQQSSYENDQYSEGELFMKSRAGAFLAAGGLPISAGGGGGGAGTTCTSTIEAETMAHETGGPVAGGWNLWSNGGARTTRAFASGPTTLAVVARGTSAAGVWPHMVVSLDGVVVGATSVASTGYQTYSFATTVATAGTRTLRVAFDNDYNANGEDRILVLDKVTLIQGCAGGGSN
jgi:hypothetical protein